MRLSNHSRPFALVHAVVQDGCDDDYFDGLAAQKFVKINLFRFLRNRVSQVGRLRFWREKHRRNTLPLWLGLRSRRAKRHRRLRLRNVLRRTLNLTRTWSKTQGVRTAPRTMAGRMERQRPPGGHFAGAAVSRSSRRPLGMATPASTNEIRRIDNRGNCGIGECKAKGSTMACVTCKVRLCRHTECLNAHINEGKGRMLSENRELHVSEDQGEQKMIRGRAQMDD